MLCPGWELAVVGVWEGGAGHGVLLRHLHRQLHGSELCQTAAAAEALGGENQVRTTHWSATKLPSDCFLLLLLGHWKTNLTPPPPLPQSILRGSETPALFVGVCVWESEKMRVLFYCLSLSSSSSAVRLGSIADLNTLLRHNNPFINLRGWNSSSGGDWVALCKTGRPNFLWTELLSHKLDLFFFFFFLI